MSASPARQAFLRVALLAALVVASPACRRSTSAAAGTSGGTTRPRHGGTLVLGCSIDIAAINELIAPPGIFNQDVIDRQFLRLLEEQPDYAEHPPTFAPRLAASYSWSPDHLTLTFELRPDAVWSDGLPVTSADVRWTWRAQTDPQVAWAYAQTKEHIRDVEVVDPHTVRFHFDSAYAAQLTDANEGVILPQHAWGELPFSEWRGRPDWFREHLVVDGPFRLAEWKPEQEIALAPNPRYFEAGLPRVDRVVFRIVPDKNSQIGQLLSGQLDFVEGISPTQASRVEPDDRARLLTFWSRQYDYIAWNTRRPLFAEPEVRRALTLAIDRQALVDALLAGRGRVGVSPILTSVWAHDPRLEPWPYDPAEARRLLAAHGWRDADGDGILDRDGTPFRFELTTNSDNRTRLDAAVMIQAQLRRVGVDAQPRGLESNSLIARNLAHDFDATLSAWAIDTSLDLEYAFATSAYADGYNFGGYSNPELDRLIIASHAQTEPTEIARLLRQAERILHRDQPYTFLWEPQRIEGVATRVRDARPNPISAYFNLREWWLAE